MKIRTKIAMAFTLLTAIALLLLSVYVYFLTRQHLSGSFFTRLKVRTTIAAEIRFADLHGDLLSDLRERHLQRLPNEMDYFFDANNTLPAQVAAQLPELPASFAEEILESGSAETSIGFQHYTGILHQSAGDQYAVIVSAYDERGAEEISYLFNILAAGFSVGCLVVFFFGRVFAFHMMKPVAGIIAKVNTITASDLGERLPSGNGEDELAVMTGTFNNMLDRLETAFELQSNFISNASHELRTPLTAILGEAEVALQLPRSQEAYVRSLNTIQQEAHRLDEITTSLLRLSQISFDGRKQKIEPVMLDELLMSVKIDLDKRMPENNTRMLIQPVTDGAELFALTCVRVWMELAIVNIIQNGIKYSNNQEVLVTLSADSHHLLIQISDFGIGIPQEEMRHILEPFFRGSNTRRYEGHGIGLPLAARIVRLHGGQMDVVSNEGVGTLVTLKFPLTPDIKIR